MQPMSEVNIYMFFYFVIFVACGVFVCVNVIVGMLVQHMIHFGSLSELLASTTKPAYKKPKVTLDKGETSASVCSYLKADLVFQFKMTFLPATESFRLETGWFCTKSCVWKDGLRSVCCVHHNANVRSLQRWGRIVQCFDLHWLGSMHSTDHRNRSPRIWIP